MIEELKKEIIDAFEIEYDEDKIKKLKKLSKNLKSKYLYNNIINQLSDYEKYIAYRNIKIKTNNCIMAFAVHGIGVNTTYRLFKVNIYENNKLYILEKKNPVMSLYVRTNGIIENDNGFTKILFDVYNKTILKKNISGDRSFEFMMKSKEIKNSSNIKSLKSLLS